MKRVREWVLVAGLLVGLSTFGAEAADIQASEQIAPTNMTGAANLWAGMHEIGMIDDAQYQHVLETGHLPGGTVVTNSPITAESQANWNQLAKQELITPDELAAMLFDGDIPGLTKEEEQAFVELAPVYQPKRSRRLTYDVRRKHARVELIRLSYRLREERAALEERARLLGIPIEIEDGVLIDIDEEGKPYYSRSLGLESCDSISTDEVWTTNATGQVNTNFNLSGTGITLAMWEWKGGVNETHQEFVGRVAEFNNNGVSSQLGAGQHASAVACIMIGGGVSNNARGAAFEADLHAYKWSGDLTRLATVANEGVIRFSNHSYYTAQGSYGQYTYHEEKCDALAYTAYWHFAGLRGRKCKAKPF